MLVFTQFRIFCLPIKIKLYITTILHVVLYECETWYLAVREEHRLRECETPPQGKFLDPRQRKQEEDRGKCIMMGLISCAVCLFINVIKSRRMRACNGRI
jgi:hypothetical protein